MDFKKLTDKAKEVIADRGGTDSLKEDAGELKDIATGKGSLTDKAKEAASALKDPGKSGSDAGHPDADAANRHKKVNRPAENRPGASKPGVDVPKGSGPGANG